MNNILIKPLVTEKVTKLNDKGVYGFIVKKDANKIEIKNAIEKAYSVTVDSINTLRTSTKPKSRYTNKTFITGRTASIKKAFVTLQKGEVIDFYSGI
ncbi:MAG: 50S ribosomal protein L23 [Cytophagales bacterium]|nr:50S ribosomal protein L23 [Cytophagales bacterium]